MMAAYLIDRYGTSVKLTDATRVVFLVGVAAIIGVGWEWYEFLADMFIFHRPWIQDSMADIMFDLAADIIGGLMYSLASRFIIFKKYI